MSKNCTLCKSTKSFSDFYKSARSKDGYQCHCKACRKGIDSTYFKQNKAAIIARWTASKDKLTQAVNDIKKASGCVKCGDTRWYILEFHHKDPSTKNQPVSIFRTSGQARRALAEIELCVLLCANCHREFHYLQRQDGITLEQYTKTNKTCESEML